MSNKTITKEQIDVLGTVFESVNVDTLEKKEMSVILKAWAYLANPETEYVDSDFVVGMARAHKFLKASLVRTIETTSPDTIEYLLARPQYQTFDDLITEVRATFGAQ
jgi:hypothetical protein